MSSDLVAPALKNKKHYNSFSPGLGFWLSLATVRSWIETDDHAVRVSSFCIEPLEPH
jgi:aprataxin